MTGADERHAEHGRLEQRNGWRDLIGELLVGRRGGRPRRGVESATQDGVLKELQHRTLGGHRQLHFRIAGCDAVS